eukprot:Tbor_TRINITY_DN5724_c0_g2::TRINITY_DN5724_c0_g2_i9::g.20469::m.20469
MASFQGIEVLPGKEVGLKAGESDVFHLSMAALPHGSRGSATIYATVDGSTFAVATLNTDAKITQVGLDLIFPKAQDPVFSVKGSTKVHLTGYTQSMDDGDMDEEESELPVTKAMNKAALRDKIQKSIGKKDAEEEDEEDDEDDEEDGEIDEDGEEDDVDGIDEDDEEDDEEDEEEEPPRKGHRVEGGSRGGDRGGRGGRGRY